MTGTAKLCYLAAALACAAAAITIFRGDPGEREYLHAGLLLFATVVLAWAGRRHGTKRPG